MREVLPVGALNSSIAKRNFRNVNLSNLYFAAPELEEILDLIFKTINVCILNRNANLNTIRLAGLFLVHLGDHANLRRVNVSIVSGLLAINIRVNDEVIAISESRLGAKAKLTD